MKKPTRRILVLPALTALAIFLVMTAGKPQQESDTKAGWVKYKGNPVLGGKLGTIFDISVWKEKDGYKMLNSWRPKKSIALSESKDGFHWTDPLVVLGPDTSNYWERDINRPGFIKKDGLYHLWYTGQAKGKSWIGYATSKDLKTWKRMSKEPVISPDVPWEKTSVMCPSVMWDEKARVFKMWYSGGEQYEPDAIGYATSLDGIHWKKFSTNPVFRNDPRSKWEQAKVTACHVIKQQGYYLMFYIGFRDVHFAQIGLARSVNGMSDWERHPDNPIISPGSGWDASAVYKPYAIFDGKKWLLWYNGRRDAVEQIGVAVHGGFDLGFPGKK